MISRRSLLASSSLLLLGQWSPRPRGQQATRTRLVLLGTAGGPTPKKHRAAPSQVILVDGAAYVIDCGNGVARQLALAGVPLWTIRHVFITHHHSDHNADYGTLLSLAWASGLQTRVDAWGPVPLARMTDLFFEMSAADLRVREVDEGKPPLRPLIHPHELADGGSVLDEGPVKVRCTRVNHPLVERAFAYRFDCPDRSIVISGDTARSANLIALARGADVLVHEVMYPPAVDAMLAGSPEPAAVKKHILASHTPSEEVGKIAAEAGVKTLVLTHFVPGEIPAVSDDEWMKGARAHFDGRIVVGRDLLEIDPD